MEYYDSINNSQLHFYYSMRNATLLSHNELIEEIDDFKKSDFFESSSLNDDSTINSKHHEKNDKFIQIKQNIYKKNTLFDPISSPENLILNSYESEAPELWKNDYTKPIKLCNKRESIGTMYYKSKKKENNLKAKKLSENEIKRFDEKNSSLFELINYNIDLQAKSFKEKKEKKQRNKNKKKFSYIKNILKRPTKIEDFLISIINKSNEEILNEENNLLKSIQDLKENKLKTEQAIMAKEIDDFNEKCHLEMQKALNELKDSFDNELKIVDGEVYPDLIKTLIEDRDVELENLTDQYEEMRRNEIEKIKSKYNKNLR